MRSEPLLNSEKTYIEACQNILDNGWDVPNERTGVGTRMMTNVVIEHSDVEDHFPMMLSKRVTWKPMAGELLWFVEGSCSNERLAEITYGDRTRKTIWSANLEDFSQTMKGPLKDNDYLGPIYGRQWRQWGGWGIDQLADVVGRIKTNPTDRRLVVSAWNPAELRLMALPPCHMIFQFNVVQDRYLDVAMFQRSGDMFLGVPFNIASYALLLKLVAKETGLIARKLTIMIGNAHIYSNHFQQVNRQIDNWHKKVVGWDIGKPNVTINSEHSMFSGELTLDDISLSDYNPIETIKGEMAV